jgi:hypothetical protein
MKGFTQVYVLRAVGVMIWSYMDQAHPSFLPVTVVLFLKKPLYLAVLLLGLYVAPMRQSQAPLASTFV